MALKLITAGFATFSSSGTVQPNSYSTTQPVISWDSDFLQVKTHLLGFVCSAAPATGLSVGFKSVMTGNKFVKGIVGSTFDIPVGAPFKGANNSPTVTLSNGGIVFSMPDKPVVSPGSLDSQSNVALYNPTSSAITYSAVDIRILAVIDE